ncbi:MAG TPA: hypothetical protein VE522_05410 [Actinomycetota bacterium]|jgi:hypothetical protein|nr:hypothetical protein [Actinomycetota bacterium]
MVEHCNLKQIGRYLNASGERARQVEASDPTFPYLFLRPDDAEHV